MNSLFRILRLGMPISSDPLEARRLLLLNLFYLLSTVTLVVSLIESYSAGEPSQVQLVLIVSILFLVAVPVTARRNTYYASALILFIANSVVFFFSNVQGFASGVYLFFFPLFFANAWLMDFRKPAFSILLVGMTVAAMVLVVLFPDSLFGFSLTPEQQAKSFILSVVSAGFVMAVNTFVIVWLNYRRQQDLEDQVSQKVKATENLSEALKEKEILIAEIHHRVKNNLAVVRGLLNMQLNNTTNEAARETLRESVNRVTAMALIHQKLYASNSAGSIDLKRYVTELAAEVAASYQSDGDQTPDVNIRVGTISLDLNRAVPCGLILNELLTNAFKHAFAKDQKGVIDVTIMPDEQRKGFTNLTVADNGKGIAPDFSLETSDSLGMTIIRSLSEQIDGTFILNATSGKGTSVSVIFPDSIGFKTLK